MEWAENLPEGVREWDEVKNSDSPEKFWTQMTDMRSSLGQSIRIPGENANDDDKTAFYDKVRAKVPGLMPMPDINDKTALDAFYKTIGRPDAADGYSMPDFGDANVNTDPVKAFMPIAHTLGLTQAQFEGVVKQATESNKADATAMATAKQADIDALKTEWGEAYPERINAAKVIAEKTGAPPEVVKAAENGTLNSTTAKWLFELSKSITPEGTNLNNDKSLDGKKTPLEAKTEIQEIYNNKEHAYWDVANVGHEAAMQLMDSLYAIAYPEDKGKSVTFSGATAGIGGIYGD